MVKLDLIHILFLAACFVAIWNIQAKWQMERRMKKLKKRIAGLGVLLKSQDTAIQNLAATNKRMIADSIDRDVATRNNKPHSYLIISNGHGYVNNNNSYRGSRYGD